MNYRKCIFCKKPFRTENPQRSFCDNLSCRIKFDYRILSKKGLNPNKYYKDKIKKGAEEICWVCEKKFKPTTIPEFFTKMCKECKKRLKKQKDQQLLKDVLSNPRAFLDSIRIDDK